LILEEKCRDRLKLILIVGFPFCIIYNFTENMVAVPPRSPLTMSRSDGMGNIGRKQIMKLASTCVVSLIAFIIVFVSECGAYGNGTAEGKNTPAYLDTNLTFEARASDLISRMTLEEKILQMQNNASAIPRLGVPAYNWWNECLHGVARNGVATVFPQAIGMAATWDPDLIRKEADVISTEARAKYNYAIGKNEHGMYQGLAFWSPNINIDRNPRFGRGQETYGEGPFLTSQIGVAFVRGPQGYNSKYLKVVATPKHFPAHSGPETSRHYY